MIQELVVSAFTMVGFVAVISVPMAACLQIATKFVCGVEISFTKALKVCGTANIAGTVWSGFLCTILPDVGQEEKPQMGRALDSACFLLLSILLLQAWIYSRHILLPSGVSVSFPKAFLTKLLESCSLVLFCLVFRNFIIHSHEIFNLFLCCSTIAAFIIAYLSRYNWIFGMTIPNSSSLPESGCEDGILDLETFDF